MLIKIAIGGVALIATIAICLWEFVFRHRPTHYTKNGIKIKDESKSDIHKITSTLDMNLGWCWNVFSCSPWVKISKEEYAAMIHDITFVILEKPWPTKYKGKWTKALGQAKFGRKQIWLSYPDYKAQLVQHELVHWILHLQGEDFDAEHADTKLWETVQCTNLSKD